jgi:Rrf2 family protein
VRITAKVDYGVRATVELATAGQSPVKGDVIAERQRIPVRFLENILADLRRAGLVASQRGADGGYWLAVPATSITVADIIRAVEGPLADVHGTPPEQVDYPGSAQGLRRVWVATRATLRSLLENVTVADVAADRLPAPFEDLLADPDAWARRASAVLGGRTAPPASPRSPDVGAPRGSHVRRGRH